MQQVTRIKTLDGLRCLAFLAVFLSHFPVPTGNEVWHFVQQRGWIGVDLFFAISAFLFLHMFTLETERSGAVSLPRFFIRRFLRIYPLMITYALVMLLWLGTGSAAEWGRLAGIALSLDNLVHIVSPAAQEIPRTGHLWSLSFEFQLYLLVPVFFVAYQRLSRKHFARLLVGVAVFAAIARGTFNLVGADELSSYYLPFLRPDAFLIGLALAAFRPNWHWGLSAAAGVIAFAALLTAPLPWDGATGAIISYPLLALSIGALIDVGMRSPLAGALSSRAAAYAGKRSYGFYVFHIIAFDFTLRVLGLAGLGNSMTSSPLLTTISIGLALSITFVLAWVSFAVLEGPVDRLANRFRAPTAQP